MQKYLNRDQSDSGGHVLVPRGCQRLGPNFTCFHRCFSTAQGHLIQKYNICYSKLTKICIFDTFVLSLCESFGVKQPQKRLVWQPQKLFKVKQQLLSDIFTMKCTPANFIGCLWNKSSLKITFHRSQKCISPI